MPFVSYAQNQEDVLLHRVFGGQETGFYVDVGAFHPVRGSVTKAFYDRGWSGINVEPGQVFEELAAARPRDVNLRMAALDRVGEVAFVEDAADAGMSHVAATPGGPGPGPAARMVPCDTIENIIRDHSRRRPVDFLKIDAEGAEAAIIGHTDWRRLRPRVLVIETTLPWSTTLANQDWEPVLLEQGYLRAFFDGINCFYIPEEEAAALLRHFQAPVNVLDSARQYDPAAEAVAAERDRLHASLAAAEAERERLRAEVVAAQAAAETERERLRADAEAAQAAAETERERLRADAEAAQAAAEAERERLRAEVVSAQAAAETERERLRADAAAAQAAAEAERERLRAELGAAQAANAAADASRAALDQQVALLGGEVAQVSAQRNTLATILQTLEQTAMPTPPPIPVTIAPARPLVQRILRRSVRLAYGVVRPVVRPAAWRLRGFLQAPLAGQAQQTDDAVRALQAEVRAGLQARQAEGQVLLAGLQALQAEGQVLRAEVQGLTSAPGITTPAGLAELRRLAEEVERAILTLAMAAAADRAPPSDGLPSDGPPSDGLPPEGPPPDGTGAARAAGVPLRLPDGRLVQVEPMPGDLSVSAALRASGGEWEPHVRRFLAGVVQPNWVCADIGANVGTHSLALASLARDGRVFAFEADPANHAVLTRNIAALPPPAGPIEALHLALWDRRGTLVIGGAAELAGCSFVTEEPTDAAATERRLRAVVDAAALDGTELHVRLSEVPALPLDEWAEAAALPRLDLIKLDVEGAEARVIRGADRTLRRHRPVLLVEYNPACAASYFDQPADALFRELESRFEAIHALEEDGALMRLADWEALRTRLEAGKGWEDLVCLPAAVAVDAVGLDQVPTTKDGSVL